MPELAADPAEPVGLGAPAPVVALAPGRVAQDLQRGVQLDHLRGGLESWRHVRVVLAGEPPIDDLDDLEVGLRVDLEHLVRIEPGIARIGHRTDSAPASAANRPPAASIAAISAALDGPPSVVAPPSSLARRKTYLKTSRAAAVTGRARIAPSRPKIAPPMTSAAMIDSGGGRSHRSGSSGRGSCSRPAGWRGRGGVRRAPVPVRRSTRGGRPGPPR